MKLDNGYFQITEEEFNTIKKRKKHKLYFKNGEICRINNLKVGDIYCAFARNHKLVILGFEYDYNRTTFYVYYIKDKLIHRIKLSSFYKGVKEGYYGLIKANNKI